MDRMPMTQPMHASPGDTGLRRVQRRLAGLMDGAGLDVDTVPPLEALHVTAGDPPRLRDAPVIEGHGMRVFRVDGDPTTGFGAFLDGTQTSRPIGYCDGLPIVVGTVAAVVRERRNRRHVTWARGPLVERRVYAPVAFLRGVICDALRDDALPLVDTSQADEQGERPNAHPLSLHERAVHFVQADRERVERQLAESWCRTEHAPLFVDGGIQGSELVASSSCVVGVVKTHRTLYVEGDAVRLVLGLRAGQRSSVFRIAAPRRAPVASWYLRLRDPAGRDPMWGLLRVEAADRAPDETPEALGARVDRLSRWILAESAPIALPDGRWDKMVYGIRDCEQFLRAVC
jgi:hypothetical protein